MTLEHITITEEVVKDGKVVTESRETVQYTPDTTEPSGTNLAYGLNHPGFVSAQDRVYTYNEETGMSESRPAETAVEEESELESVELTDQEILQEWIEDYRESGGTIELDRDFYLDGPVEVPENVSIIGGEYKLYAVAPNDVLIDGDGTYTETVAPVVALCHHPVGNGECQLPADHEGQHKLNVD